MSTINSPRVSRTVTAASAWGPTALRVGIGSAMMINGAGKVLGWGPRALGMDAFVGFITALGLPFPMFLAWAGALAEMVGGLLILVGLFTRPAAVFTAITMGVALFAVHIPGGFPLETVGAAYTTGEYTFVLIAGSLSLIMLGAGRLSLERAIFGRELLPRSITELVEVPDAEIEQKRQRPT